MKIYKDRVIYCLGCDTYEQEGCYLALQGLTGEADLDRLRTLTKEVRANCELLSENPGSRLFDGIDTLAKRPTVPRTIVEW